MMLNAGIHQPDGIILDLEDSVAPDKEGGSPVAGPECPLSGGFLRSERMVRINQLPAGLEDLDEVVPHQVHLVLIPKCENGSQVKQVDRAN